jgi:hypothetical protein
MKTHWRKSLVNLITWIFTRIWAPMMAIGWPILVCYGLANPRPDDLAMMNLAAHETALLVGGRFVGKDCAESQACLSTPTQRNYLLPRRIFKNDGVLTISDDSGRLAAEGQPGVAFLLLAVWIACIGMTWRYLVSPLVTASKKSLERTSDG